MPEAIGKRDRFEVFKRDKFTCQYCGQKPPQVVLHVDHILAISNGGGNGYENLITSCQDCNLGKSNVLIERTAAPMNFSVEDHAEKLRQLQAYADQLAAEASYLDECLDKVIELWCKSEGQPAESETWRYDGRIEDAARRFLKELPVQEVLDAVQISYSKYPIGRSEWQRMKYFFGVCWKKIRDRKEPCT